MKRKTSNVPSRIWAFRAYAPTIGADIIDRQIEKTRAYYNVLVEIEREAQDTVKTLQYDHPHLGPLLRKLDDVVAEYENINTAIKAAKQAARSAKVDVSELRDKARAKKVEIAAVRAEMKKARKAANAELKPQFDAVRDHAKSRVKIARGAADVYWGNYLLAEKAIEGALNAQKKTGRPPRFKNRTDSVRIGVQFQKSATKGVSPGMNGAPIQDLFDGVDLRLRINAATNEKHTIKAKNNKTVEVRDRKSDVMMRVGSNGREPVWATIPIIFHREFPLDAVVKTAWLRRERIGTKNRYTFEMTLESATFEAPKRPTQKTAALDVGWRAKEEGGLRIFVLRDCAGNTREYKLPELFRMRYDKTTQIRSQRDENFNKARDGLVAWKRANAAGHHQTVCPQWLTERTTHVHAWRAAAKLAALVLHWRENRFDGDDAIYPALEAWRRQDKHLLEWEANLRDKVIAARTHYYRAIAKYLTTQYDRIVLEDFDLRKVTKRKQADEEPDSRHGSDQRFQVAISDLRRRIESAAQRTGCTVVKVDPANTTKMCAICGVIETWDAAKKIVHTCSNGHSWDQDVNAAVNLIERAGAADATSKDSEPLQDG